MLLLAVALVVFFVVYQRRLLAQHRQMQQEEIRHQQALLAAAVDVQEAERRRIARDLHDDIGSLLTAARLYLRQMKAGGDAGRNEEIRQESLNILDEIIQNTRRITHDLLPAELEKFGFIAAAEDLCDRLNNSGGVSVDFTATVNKRLPEQKEIALYRVLQELLNNTIKHAEAKRIEVHADWLRDRFRFAYQDNGRGFEMPERGTSTGGLGLKNIESRISLVGGSVDYRAAPGQGVSVNIDLPITQESTSN
ncbi:sensor histidine kinase [Lewinella sp. W8]|uniref:sensor histidine kinase n=1 Tax=Lewinella sp. W8 TaxID=2528208 RepID=UPI001563B5E4|nr:sensor histidine kinase [Lewinella sp. W8]